MLQEYVSFFTATSQAAAALVGLLFVVLAVDVDFDKEARFRQFALSENAFISLGGVFVISLLALLPRGLLLMVVASIALSVLGTWVLLRRTHRVAHDVLRPLDFWFSAVTVGAYALLAAAGLWIAAAGGTGALNFFCVLITVIIGLSLVRAWRTLLITRRTTHHAPDQRGKP